jgi:hypothetical protein
MWFLRKRNKFLKYFKRTVISFFLFQDDGVNAYLGDKELGTARKRIGYDMFVGVR